MILPRAAKVALYVGITVVDLDTEEPVVLDWQLSLAGGEWIDGTRTTFTDEDDAEVDVIRFLLAGPDADNTGADAVVTESSDVRVRATDGDEVLVLVDYVAPVTVI